MTRRHLPLAALTALLAAAVLAQPQARARTDAQPTREQPVERILRRLPPQVFHVTDLSIDHAGNLVVAGVTYSSDFPTSPDAVQRWCGEEGDAFVMVVSTAGDLLYSTCLGTMTVDMDPRVAPAPDGSIWVAMNSCFYFSTGIGNCTYSGFYATVLRIVPGLPLPTDRLWVAGGYSHLEMADLAAAADGSVWVVGTTSTPNLPTVNAWQPTLAGGADIFLAHYTTSGPKPLLETYLGGSGFDVAQHVVVAPDGDAIVTGATGSRDFPTVRPFQRSSGGDYDSVVARIDATGRWLEYSTYLGGSAPDWHCDVAVDHAGNVYALGQAPAADFPPSTSRRSGPGKRDVYFISLDSTGRLRFTTLLETGLETMEDPNVGAGPFDVVARGAGSVLVVGSYYTGEIFEGGGFIAVADQSGTAIREPLLMRGPNLMAEFVGNAAADRHNVYVVATPRVYPPQPYYLKAVNLPAHQPRGGLPPAGHDRR